RCVGRSQDGGHRPRAAPPPSRGLHRVQAHLREHRADRHRLVPAQGLLLAPGPPRRPPRRGGPSAPAPPIDRTQQTCPHRTSPPRTPLPSSTTSSSAAAPPAPPWPPA